MTWSASAFGEQRGPHHLQGTVAGDSAGVRAGEVGVKGHQQLVPDDHVDVSLGLGGGQTQFEDFQFGAQWAACMSLLNRPAGSCSLIRSGLSDWKLKASQGRV